MAKQTMDRYSVYYGYGAEPAGWLEDETALDTFHRETLECVRTGRPAYVRIFGDGRSEVSLLIAPGIPVFTQAVPSVDEI